MSALTDLFTSLANKVRSKLGTTGTYTPAQAVSAIDTVYTEGQRNPKIIDVTSTNVTYNQNGTGFKLSKPNTTYIILAANGAPIAAYQNSDAVAWGRPYDSSPYFFSWKNSSSTGIMIIMRTNSLASDSHAPYVYLSGVHGTSANSSEKLLEVTSGDLP